MDRKIASAYCGLVAITTVFAFAAVVWLGPGSSLEGVPGILVRSDSVWRLFAAPALLTLIGLFGTFTLNSERVYARPDDLSPEAQRGLAQHRSAERRLLIGFGILVAFVQLLTILRTAGLDVPFESGVRTTFFALGALFASAGNMFPKIPFFSRWWQINRAVYTRVSRFGGLVLTLAGFSICLLAVLAPVESLRRTTAIVLASAVGLTIVNALLHALLAGKKAS